MASNLLPIERAIKVCDSFDIFFFYDKHYYDALEANICDSADDRERALKAIEWYTPVCTCGYYAFEWAEFDHDPPWLLANQKPNISVAVHDTMVHAIKTDPRFKDLRNLILL